MIEIIARIINRPSSKTANPPQITEIHPSTNPPVSNLKQQRKFLTLGTSFIVLFSLMLFLIKIKLQNGFDN